VHSLIDGTETTIAHDDESIFGPVWAPDESQIAYIGGSKIIRHDESPSYSGEKLIFAVFEYVPGQLYIVPTVGGKSTAIDTPGEYNGIAWADSTHVTYDRQSNGYKTRTIYLGSAKGGAPQAIHEDKEDKFWSLPDWEAEAKPKPSPNGKWIAFLTDLAPGRQFARTVARPQAPRPIAAPPPDATVLAGESGDRAVGLAVSPRGKLQATVLGGDGNGVDGLSVAFRAGGRTFDATGCGPGCYRARGRIQARRVTVVLDSGPVAFGIPVRTEQASAAVAAARRAFAGLRSLVIHERLASSPRDKVVTTWRIVAPDRLTYVTSAGTQAIVIGTKRWDADAKGPFVRSAQVPPLQLPPAEWGPRWLNAKAIGWRRVGGRRARLVSFFDPHLPAWFELAFDPRTHRPLALDMTAAEHFMNQRYTNLNERMRIAPPR